MSQQRPNRLTRSQFLRATGTVAAAATAASLVGFPAPPAGAQTPSQGAADPLLGELDAKIRAGMRDYGIPGVALGMIHEGSTYIKGYGVTNVDYPVPVDGDTLFRSGSINKTFTGTAAMRLVEQGKLDLDARVRGYLPHFATSRPSVARRVTLRQLLNHTPGWLGEYLEDMGPGDDALARYVERMARLPQLTPLGSTFFYNNAAIALAGRVIEAATGSTYEEALRELVLDPLGMDHTYFFSDEIVGFNVAASHNLVDGKPVVDTSFWHIPRSLNPSGGLIFSVRDLLRHARFHLGDGRAPDGTRLLTEESLEAMRSDPGPGGTLNVELDGMGVTWQLRPSAEGVRIVEHGGDVAGQHAGFFMVPEVGLALGVLTNSESGPRLLTELFDDDWALTRFAGVSNPPAEPRALTESQLAPYEGLYTGQAIGYDGSVTTTEMELKADKGRLHVTQRQRVEPALPGFDPSGIAQTGDVPTVEFLLVFYRDDYVIITLESGDSTFRRADFLRGQNGRVEWLRYGGQLHLHQGV